MELKLKGDVILDNESMEELKEKIREEVINDIKENGNSFCEIEDFLNVCEYREYIDLIKCTIDDIISKTDINNITFDNEKKAYTRILAIKSILNI